MFQVYENVQSSKILIDVPNINSSLDYVGILVVGYKEHSF